MRCLRTPRFAACLAVLAFASVAVAPSVDAGAGAGGATIRIGLEAPLTGDQRSIGEGMLRGAQLAATQLNENGGIDGRQVEIVPIDDAATPATGVTAANAAIAAGLDGVVGPYNSGVGAQTLPLYIAAGLVPIRLTSADSTSGLGFTLQPMTSQIAPAASDALTKWLKAKSVGIIYDDTTLYTQTVSAALKTELEDADVTVSAFEPIEPGASTYKSAIESVADTNPDVIYLATYFPEAGLMAKEILAAGGQAKCLADYGAYDNGYVQAAGKKAARKCPVVGVPAPDEFSGSRPYIRAYRGAFDAAPGAWSPYTYDSVNFLAAGVEQAGWDATALSAALDRLSGFSGWTGPVAIDPATGNRDPATVVVLGVNKKGTFRIDKSWAKAVGAQT